jgi:tetratricopeptide (TPR) repeat protein
MKDDVTRRIVDLLDVEIRRRGRGMITRVTELVGREGGWWRQRFEKGDLKVSQMTEIISLLRLDLVRFMRRVAGSESWLEVDQPSGPQPEIVRKAWARLETDYPGDMGRGYLDELDALRYREPQEVVHRASSIVDHVQVELLPLLLGIAGSSFRRWNLQLDAAEHSIIAGISMGQKLATGDGDIASLLLRLAYVQADRGEHASALQIVEKSMSLYLRMGDDEGFLRALVNQASWLSYLGRYQDAVAALQVALKWLPEHQERHIFSALQILGVCHRELGEVEKALDFVKKAEALPQATEDWARDRLIWLRANIYADLNRLEESSALLSDVLESFARIHLGEMALVACDLVRVELLRNQPASAFQVAQQLLKLMEPLRHNPIIGAAVADLLRRGEEGLTLALIRSVKSRLESELKKREAASLLRINSSDG